MLYLSKKLKLRISSMMLVQIRSLKYVTSLQNLLYYRTEGVPPSHKNKPKTRCDISQYNKFGYESIQILLSRFIVLGYVTYIQFYICFFLDEESTTRALITAPNARKTPIVVQYHSVTP